MKKTTVLMWILLSVLGVAIAWSTEGYKDLLKLVKSGTGDEIIIAFINASNISYTLTADEIIRLKEEKASSPVLVAAIVHKKQTRISNRYTPSAESEQAAPIAVSYDDAPYIAIDNSDYWPYPYYGYPFYYGNYSWFGRGGFGHGGYRGGGHSGYRGGGNSGHGGSAGHSGRR